MVRHILAWTDSKMRVAEEVVKENKKVGIVKAFVASTVESFINASAILGGSILAGGIITTIVKVIKK